MRSWRYERVRHDFRCNDRVNWSTEKARKCVFSPVFTQVQLLFIIEARFRIRFSNRLSGIITEISCCNWKMCTRICELDTAFNGRSTWFDLKWNGTRCFLVGFDEASGLALVARVVIDMHDGGVRSGSIEFANCQSEEQNNSNRNLVAIVHVGLIWTMQLATIELPVMVRSLFVCVYPGVSVIWTHSITRDPKLHTLTSFIYFSCW